MSIRTAEDFDALVARIKEQDREVKAWRAFSGNSALKAARIGEFDHAPRPLEGLTVGVKDIIDVAGLPTRCGSPLFENAPPAVRDAAVVAKMREAGAIIVGKTVTTELATFVPAETRNPRDLTRTPGGSSSGSAAAIAAGHVDIAIGTQTAGSIIRPAAYCGVYGFKPSFGLVPIDGVLVQCPSFDTVGVFARSLAHIEAWMEVAAKAGQTNKRSQIKIDPRLGILDLPPNSAEATRRAIDRSVSDLQDTGLIVEPLSLPIGFIDAQLTIQAYESSRVFSTFPSASLSMKLQKYVFDGSKISSKTYEQALVTLSEAKAWSARIGSEFDALLSPSALDEAPTFSVGTGDPICCRLASFIGLPAINLPMSWRGGLPIGVQLMGLHSDKELLTLAGRLTTNQLV